MTTTGYLFEDKRDEGSPYALFIDGLQGDDGEDQTIEVRFNNLWQFADCIIKMAASEDLGFFPLKLGEPEHYAEVSAEAWSEDGEIKA